MNYVSGSTYVFVSLKKLSFNEIDVFVSVFTENDPTTKGGETKH